jgi:hypothetical protein
VESFKVLLQNSSFDTELDLLDEKVTVLSILVTALRGLSNSSFDLVL